MMTIELKTTDGVETKEVDGWSLTPSGVLVLQHTGPEGQQPEFFNAGYWRSFKQITPIQPPDQQSQIVVPKIVAPNLKLT